jgi:HD-like signal output (HDOD) protein/CheY-like chemotaxis protein
MKRILFVDDEPAVLQGLRRMLHAMRTEWEMEFVESAREGLDRLAQEPFDLVVSDMRMPQMDGAEFLARVQRDHPNTVRIILSGFADREAILRVVGPAHQFLSKPCDPTLVRSTIERALGLRNLLRSERLASFVGGLATVPSVPHLYRQVLEELEDPDCSLARVGELVAQDVAMSAELLKIVNSAYFGLTTPVSTAGKAVSLLGLETINSLVLGVGIFSEFAECPAKFPIETVWRSSLLAAAAGRQIAKEEGLTPDLADRAFLAGILHRIGQLVLAVNAPEKYARVLAGPSEQPLEAREQAAFQTSHCEVGGYLLRLWGMEDALVEAVAFRELPIVDPLELARPRGLLRVALALTQAGEESKESVRAEIAAIGGEARWDSWCRAVQRVSDSEVVN